MKNSQEFTHVQKDIVHLYNRHLATIRIDYKITSLVHHIHSSLIFLFCMLVVNCTVVID